jgi:polysaccharide export outer membrane protein
MRNTANRSIGTRVLLAIFCVTASIPTTVAAARGFGVQSSATHAASSDETSPTTKPHDATYLIGSSDVLAITVWKEPEISRSIPVRPDGKISLPLVGEIQAAGRTPIQLEQDIATKLQAYISKPDVTVIVEQINSEKFNILGRVSKPGSYPLSATTTVLDAIATAGGFLDFAKQSSIYILRPNAQGGQSRLAFNYKQVIKGNHSEQNVRLEPHDTIIVP